MTNLPISNLPAGYREDDTPQDFGEWLDANYRELANDYADYYGDGQTSYYIMREYEKGNPDRDFIKYCREEYGRSD